jgi:putative membrane protein insertion efficiency factor
MVKRIAEYSIIMAAMLSLAVPVSSGDIGDDLAFIIHANPPAAKTESHPNLFANQASELKMAMTGTIRLYQLLISSQDLSACIFQPSCSRFGMRAINEFGPLHGVLMTADRLQRCNGLARNYYHVDPETGKAIDYPIDNYYIFYLYSRAEENNQ